MKKKVLMGAIIFFAVVIMFLFRLIPAVGIYLFDLFIAAIAIISGLEMSKLMSKMGAPNFEVIIGAYPSFMYLGHLLCILLNASIAIYFTVQILILISVFAISYVYSVTNSKSAAKGFKGETLNSFSLKRSVYTLIGCIYPSLFLLFLMLINRFDQLSFAFESLSSTSGNLSLIVLILAFLLPMITDTFSMLTGILIGGVKLCPGISPKKTVSGAVGGLVWSSLISALLYFVFAAIAPISTLFTVFSIKLYHFVILGLISSVACQFGDLFESFLKRQAHVKDSGDILREHGGFLDRLDSHIFNAPIVFAFFLIIL